MGLTSEKSLQEIMALYNMCFDANALCDRIAYIISVPYNQVRFGDWFHHNIAHFFTGEEMADGIEGFGELRGDLFYRGSIGKHDETYINLASAMEKLALYLGKMQEQCVIAIHTCADNGDESYEDYLRDLNKGPLTQLIKQITVFYQAIKQYEDTHDLHKWNKDFKAWITPYFKERQVD